MAKPIRDNPKTPRGRPATGKSPMVGVQMHEGLQDLIKNWAVKQNDHPSLASAIRRLVEAGAEGEEMTVTGLRELEEVAVKLEANARKLPVGPIRDELLQDIAIFRAQVAALQAAALRPSGEGLKAKGK